MPGGGFGLGGGMPGGIALTNPVVIMRSLEGVYLKGQGVVYTATVSSLQLPAKADAGGVAKEGRWAIVPRDSEWDSVRRQVRKEKEEPKKLEVSKPPVLSDVLLKVLMDNGHHFSQLGQDENLTLVLTVRETNPSGTARKGKPRAEGATKANSQAPAGGADDLQDKKMRDVELLAELHLKQGRYKESLKLWGDIETMRRETLAKQGLNVADDPDQNGWATLYRKMAQCYLGLEQTEQARHALDQSTAFDKRAKEAAENKDKPAPAATPEAELPVKLIISAPKSLLHGAKDGRIPFEEFRRRARVETIDKSGTPK